MGRDVEDMARRFEQNRAAFDQSADLASFAAAIGSAHLARYVGGWADLVFRAAKAHGLENIPHRALHMPEAMTLAEIIEDVRLLPCPTGGLYREEAERLVGGRRYCSTTRLPGAPGGHMGGKRSYSPDWLARGERVRSISGAAWSGVYAMPTAAMRKAWEAQMGPADPVPGDRGSDFALTGFEFVRWQDGRTLVIASSGSVFSQWVAVLPAGACDLAAMLPAEDREAWEADKAAEAKAWPAVPKPNGWWRVTGEDRQLGALGVLEPFETLVKAGSAEDAKDLAHLQRTAARREHTLCKTAVLERGL